MTKIYAQQATTITGNIKNSQTKENLSAVSVIVKGSATGTYTDEKGNFRLVTNAKPPFTIVISSIGYAEKEVNVESDNQTISAELEPSYALGQEIVVAASRLPQRILEAPVTIDRINANNIRNAPGPNYYDALGNIKGVDVVSSSYTFKTISTRGFNGSGNLRFNQLVDGMDNSAPALNFSVGNVIGLTDLDVDNMELLSGASSALYGSGGMTGTLLINSKDPFKYQGFSIQVKEGIMHVDDYRHKVSPFHDFSFRWGKKVSDKFAFKIGAEYIQADDWQADDSTDLLRNNVYSKITPGTRATDPNYDGVNVYGDEASASLVGLGLSPILDPRTNPSLFPIEQYLGITPGSVLNPTQLNQLLGVYAADPNTYGVLSLLSGNIINGRYSNSDGSPVNVSRTGYYEKDLVNYNAYDFKISGGLYYKLSANTEASLTANWGEGTTVYTGADRYSLKNFSIGQYKLEFKNPVWFLRAYTTQENSGDSYATTLTALSINNQWKSNKQWFTDYFNAYTAAVAATPAGTPPSTLDASARAYADQGRYLPGTKEY
ncbi:MAG TPA: carboxypeptidase-like regulatory domain-containing protein, partial [Parafilimonas sp.]|nr:carboxypeptidase-like regulatory domain-containing protein [Parafilimonas sp.]